MNASIDIKRRAASRPLTSLDALQAKEDAGAAGGPAPLQIQDEATEAPVAAASRHELEGDIQRAIDRLSPKMRTIIVLRYLESLSYDEIATLLEIEAAAARKRYGRALLRLQQSLADDGMTESQL